MWWEAMSVLQRVAFVIACSATAVLIVQIVLMLIGGTDSGFDGGADLGGASDIDIDADIDVDVDADADVGGGISDVSDAGIPHGGARFGLRLVSLRSIMAFITVGSWLCYTLCYMLDWYIALAIALAGGFAAACGMAGALIGMEKLQCNGNLDPDNAIGKRGTVYLTIPPERSGTGKINILLQERYAEYDAVTDGDEPLPTSSEIIVTGRVGANVLLVERYKKPCITVENVK